MFTLWSRGTVIFANRTNVLLQCVPFESESFASLPFQAHPSSSYPARCVWVHTVVLWRSITIGVLWLIDGVWRVLFWMYTLRPHPAVCCPSTGWLNLNTPLPVPTESLSVHFAKNTSRCCGCSKFCSKTKTVANVAKSQCGRRRGHPLRSFLVWILYRVCVWFCRMGRLQGHQRVAFHSEELELVDVLFIEVELCFFCFFSTIWYHSMREVLFLQWTECNCEGMYKRASLKNHGKIEDFFP